MKSQRWIRSWTTMVFGAALIAGACGDKIVYRDRDPFTAPPTGAEGYLGYSNAEIKRTTCGNCHIGKQTQWRQTAHADAWHSLAATGVQNESCEACHAVSSRGNTVTETNVGWVATKDTRYHDVQCESCHGPGLTHVLNPDLAANKPLAPIRVGTALDFGCGQCHSGAHQPFAEEWASSRHARVVASRATNASCTPCHEPKGTLAAWGVNSNFIEIADPGEHMAITCAVCHDPHDARNPGQLRFPIDVPVIEQNLCMKCHYRRAEPLVTSAQGPHSPQGPLLLGEAGWFPPNFEFPPGALVGSHGSDQNPRLCATCHVNRYDINDPATGGLTFRSTGHSFQPIPCVDANGVPTGETDCDLTQRSFRSCTDCHLSENAARTALSVARLRLERLADDIAAMLPQIPASEFSTTDNRISTGEGARFNMQLARDAGAAAHNPFLLEALLIRSIQQIAIDYGIVPTAGASLQMELRAR